MDSMTNVSVGNNPNVSVIVPVYNAASFIRECIDSVLCQQYKNFELILIDDGSSDRSMDICQEYGDSRIVIIAHESNKGVSEARNTGIEVARGKWLAFVDADDTVSPDWLSGFLNYDGNADLITHSVLLKKRNGENDTVCHDAIGKSIEQNIFELYKNHLLGFVWSMFIRSGIIRQHNLKFDHRLKAGEDLEFISRYCSYIKKIETFNKGTYIYTYPIRENIRYGNITNVQFRVFENLRKVVSGEYLHKLAKEIAPYMVIYIFHAHINNDKGVAKQLSDYYRSVVNPPFFLKKRSGVGIIGNILIKLRAKRVIRIIAPVLYDKERSRNLYKFIDF